LIQTKLRVGPDEMVSVSVSMPVRAFLDSDFRWNMGVKHCEVYVSMPVRAFLDSDPMERSRKSTMYPVSMPVRAFLDSDM